MILISWGAKNWLHWTTNDRDIVSLRSQGWESRSQVSGGPRSHCRLQGRAFRLFMIAVCFTCLLLAVSPQTLPPSSPSPLHSCVSVSKFPSSSKNPGLHVGFRAQANPVQSLLHLIAFAKFLFPLRSHSQAWVRINLGGNFSTVILREKPELRS